MPRFAMVRKRWSWPRGRASSPVTKRGSLSAPWQPRTPRLGASRTPSVRLRRRTALPSPPAKRRLRRRTRNCWNSTGLAALTMKPSSPVNRRIAWLIATIILLGCGWLWWLCQHDSGIPFLPDAGSAQWMLYPKPPDATPHGAMPLWAVFHRSFTLTAVPTTAKLSARAFKQGMVRINGQLVDSLVLREADWKRSHSSEVARFLKAGENEISVTVSNSLGPPALWLSLEWDTQTLLSDPEWRVSMVGAALQKAVFGFKPTALCCRPTSG